MLRKQQIRLHNLLKQVVVGRCQLHLYAQFEEESYNDPIAEKEVRHHKAKIIEMYEQYV